MDVPLKLIKHINGSDVELVVVKDADHRFSSEKCLELICNAIMILNLLIRVFLVAWKALRLLDQTS